MNSPEETIERQRELILELSRELAISNVEVAAERAENRRTDEDIRWYRRLFYIAVASIPITTIWTIWMVHSC